MLMGVVMCSVEGLVQRAGVPWQQNTLHVVPASHGLMTDQNSNKCTYLKGAVYRDSITLCAKLNNQAEMSWIHPTPPHMACPPATYTCNVTLKTATCPPY